MTTEAKILIGTGIITCLLFLGIVFTFNQEKTVAAGRVADQALVNGAKNHALTSENATVTITEFADFQCPACAKTAPLLKQLLKEYPGQINLIYRHFPLPQHANAMTSIKAAEAASEQGKFWEMSELLYANQTEWSNLEDPKGIYTQYALQLGIDQAKFIEAYTNHDYQALINQDLKDAKELGVNSTPTLYINNKKYSGNLSLPELKNAIENELKNSY